MREGGREIGRTGRLGVTAERRKTGMEDEEEAKKEKGRECVWIE